MTHTYACTSLPSHTPVSVVSLPVSAQVTSAHSVRTAHPEHVVSHAHGEPAVPLNEVEESVDDGLLSIDDGLVVEWDPPVLTL